MRKVQVATGSKLCSFITIIIDETAQLFTSLQFKPIMNEIIFHRMKWLLMNLSQH